MLHLINIRASSLILRAAIVVFATVGVISLDSILLRRNVVHAANPPKLAADADVYLVPIGPVPVEALQSLANHYRSIAHLKVEITAELPLPENTNDPLRKQLIAEKVHVLMERVFSSCIQNTRSIIVGLSAYDMYIANSDWRYAFAYGQGRYALVSVAQMNDGHSTEIKWSMGTLERVKKMVGKRIAIQHFEMGKATPLPPILASSILGIDDLDQLNGDEIDKALTIAADSIVRNYQSTTAEPLENSKIDIDDILLWLAVLFWILLVPIITWLLRVDKRAQELIIEEWRSFALQHNWEFIEGEKPWYMRTPLIIKGEIEGISFTLRWYQDGSYIGKNVHFKTHFVSEITSPYVMSITPSSSFFSSMITRGKVKTGDRLYDCRFVTRSSGARLILPDALRRRHLAMPASVHLGNRELQLIYKHNGDSALANVQAVLDLARAWFATIRGNADKLEARAASTPNILRNALIRCCLSKVADLLFWVYMIGTLPLLFFIRGEDTNLPWSITWKFIAPVGTAVLVVWLIWLWAGRQLRVSLFENTLFLAIALGGFWLMSWPWIMALNAVVGPQAEVVVVGPVIDMQAPTGRRNNYFVTLRDVEEQREVKVSVNRSTYEGLRLGDPVGFRFKKGGLGIYHNCSWPISKSK